MPECPPGWARRTTGEATRSLTWKSQRAGPSRSATRPGRAPRSSTTRPRYAEATRHGAQVAMAEDGTDLGQSLVAKLVDLRPVGAVVEGDDQDVHLRARDRVKLLGVHHQQAVPVDQDDPLARMRRGGAHRVGEAVADGAELADRQEAIQGRCMWAAKYEQCPEELTRCQSCGSAASSAAMTSRGSCRPGSGRKVAASAGRVRMAYAKQSLRQPGDSKPVSPSATSRASPRK